MHSLSAFRLHGLALVIPSLSAFIPFVHSTGRGVNDFARFPMRQRIALRNHPELAMRKRPGICSPARLLLAGCIFFVAALACWIYVLLHFGQATGLGLLDWSSSRAWKVIFNRRPDLWMGAQCTSEDARRLTVPLTLLFVLGEWCQKLGLETHSDNLIVHIIGATNSFEALSDWPALLEFKPRGVTQLTVVLVMGEPTLREEADGVPFRENEHALNSCAHKREGLHVMCVDSYYQDFHAQAVRSQWLPAPHLILLFSAIIGSPAARGLEPVTRNRRTHSRARVHLHTCTHASTHTRAHAHKHARTRALARAHAQSRAHTRAPTDKHTHACTGAPPAPCGEHPDRPRHGGGGRARACRAAAPRKMEAGAACEEWHSGCRPPSRERSTSERPERRARPPCPAWNRQPG